MFTLLMILTPCGGCALRLETSGGDSWSMGLSRRTVSLQPLDRETALAKENCQAAPLDLAIVPYGLETALGWQEQARGCVLANSVTNRFVSPSGLGFGNVNGWYFGLVHYRIPRESTRVRLHVNTVNGASLRIATSDSHVKIGGSKTTLTTVEEDGAAGTVDYQVTPSAPDFHYSAQPTAIQ